jgi:hypothetical protein
MRQPKGAKNPRTTATLTVEQGRLLKAMADRQKVSVAWLIRHAVDRLIEEESKGLQLPLDMPARPKGKDTEGTK